MINIPELQLTNSIILQIEHNFTTYPKIQIVIT